MDIQKLSPMMQKYMQTKEEYSDCILFYRLGDFYEMFFDDAITASRELEITLTGKECGLEERAPMCGVPFHSAAMYIGRLVEKGYKVAICEQVEDPKTAKGLVKREVTQVVTPGTIIDENLLDDKSNNYLCVIVKQNDKIGIAFSDISTGDMYAALVDTDDGVINEIARYSPSEILVNSEAFDAFNYDIMTRMHIGCTRYPEKLFVVGNTDEIIKNQFGKSAQQLGLDDKPQTYDAVIIMIKYLEHTQRNKITSITSLNIYTTNQYMDIDAATRRNLEITETMRDKAKRGSLLWILDKTKTSMGARLLKQWLEKPLVNPIQINNRLYSVAELVDNVILLDDVRNALSNIYDIRRIASRISMGSATPKDMGTLRNSLEKLPELAKVLSTVRSPVLSEMSKRLDTMDDILDLLKRGISDEPPAVLKDGGIIREGFSEELDTLRRAMTDGESWIAEIESEEKEKTGIKNLRVKYNKVFGYYIEVTNSYLNQVPDYFIRKQTLTNCERFITPKLKEVEETVLGASEKLIALEAKLFGEIRSEIALHVARLQLVCEVVSNVDVIASLAEVAYKNRYVMPEMTDDGTIVIKDGRHPVVECMLKNSMFVPNDTLLDSNENRLAMITGPNMAGKSTYMRQIAVITLMSQIGSFVPASFARITPVDKIFTRVGASDDISSGQSTFMLEMNEVANILHNATKNSLVILDEIGRGTSTFDGLSIAWAVAEYIHNKKKIGSKTLFATHYHELTELENSLDGVKNYRVAVKKHGDDITFLRKIVRGGADDSYGIEVAALAGVPHEVISNAKKILKKIENDDIQSAYKQKKAERKQESIGQIGFDDTIASEIADELKLLDVTTFTPIEALNKLYELVNKAKGL